MAYRFIKYENRGAGMAAVFEDDDQMFDRTVRVDLAFIKSSLETRIANGIKYGFDVSVEQAAIDGWPAGEE